MERIFILLFALLLDLTVGEFPRPVHLVVYFCRQDGKNAGQIMLRDHSRTESPNAGWPMSAIAAALNIQLEKIGYYTLGTANRPLAIDLILCGVRLVDVSVLLWAGFCLVMEVVAFAIAA